MRPFEWVILAGVAVALVGWGAARRPLRWLGAVLAVALAAHLLLEGQRLVMYPLYLLAVLFVAAAVAGRRPAPRRGGWRRGLRWTVVVLVGLILLPLPWLWPVMRLPEPGGPHLVGTTWVVVTDSARAERFGPGAGGPRRLPVQLWYPAASVSGEPAPYADPREIGFALLPPLLFQQIRYVRTHAFSDAPPAEGRFPVLVFSHGYTGFVAQNTVQMEALASRGYVVASIAHTGEAAWAPFPDGTGVPMDSALMARIMALATDEAQEAFRRTVADLAQARGREEGLRLLREFVESNPEPLRTESVREWASDTRAVVDYLEAQDQGGGTFGGRLDLGRLGVFGMSYGGATAGEYCLEEPRCRAAANMDGGQFGRMIDDTLATPLFIMASDVNEAVHRPVLHLLSGDGYLVTLPETTHLGLTDLSVMAPHLFRWTGITGRLDPDLRERYMTDYLVAFFDLYLQGRPSPLFTPGGEAPLPLTHVRRSEP